MQFFRHYEWQHPYIYSIYHRLTLAHSHTELYPHPLEGLQLPKRDIPIYRRPIAGMSLS